MYGVKGLFYSSIHLLLLIRVQVAASAEIQRPRLASFLTISDSSFRGIQGNCQGQLRDIATYRTTANLSRTM